LRTAGTVEISDPMAVVSSIESRKMRAYLFDGTDRINIRDVIVFRHTRDINKFRLSPGTVDPHIDYNLPFFDGIGGDKVHLAD